MYLPKQFEETSFPVLASLIKAHPLATVITNSPSGLNANHIPMVLSEDVRGKIVLRGHVARANPLLDDVAVSAQVLLVFQGAEHYITPSWYATKKESGKVVPTWNYAVVHVKGRMQIVEDVAWLHQQLTDLTAQQESDRDAPWAVNDAPAEFLDLIKRAIVGFEVQVDSMVGKWKVSQNQPPANRATVVQGLQAEGTEKALQMRDLVKKHL